MELLKDYHMNIAFTPINPEYVTECDECGMDLDQIRGEDFFIEECPDGEQVLCESHYIEHLKQCKTCNDRYGR